MPEFVLLARLRIALARTEKFPLAFTLGAAVLHLAMFAILALGSPTRWY